MGATISDGVKIAITMIIVCAILTIVMIIAMKGKLFSEDMSTKVDDSRFVDHILDFEAMAVYGDKLPMPNIVSALDLHGEPLVFCLQMEDLKGQYGGTPYPVAHSGTDEMRQLIALLRNYYDKEVYVYTYTGSGSGGYRGDLQLCVSELPHNENPDGEGQNWESR